MTKTKTTVGKVIGAKRLKNDKDSVVKGIRAFIKEYEQGKLIDLGTSIRDLFEFINERVYIDESMRPPESFSIRTNLDRDFIYESLGSGPFTKKIELAIDRLHRLYVAEGKDPVNSVIYNQINASVRQLSVQASRLLNTNHKDTTSTYRTSMSFRLGNMLTLIRPLPQLVYPLPLHEGVKVEVDTPTMQKVKEIRKFGGFLTFGEVVTYAVCSWPKEDRVSNWIDKYTEDFQHLVSMLSSNDSDEEIVDEISWLLRDYQKADANNYDRTTPREAFSTVLTSFDRDYVNGCLFPDGNCFATTTSMFAFALKERFTPVLEGKVTSPLKIEDKCIDRKEALSFLGQVLASLLHSNSDAHNQRRISKTRTYLCRIVADYRGFSKIVDRHIGNLKHTPETNYTYLRIDGDLREKVFAFQHRYGFQSYRSAVQYLFDPHFNNW